MGWGRPGESGKPKRVRHASLFVGEHHKLRMIKLALSASLVPALFLTSYQGQFWAKLHFGTASLRKSFRRHQLEPDCRLAG
jgi:hypothetical protein